HPATYTLSLHDALPISRLFHAAVQPPLDELDKAGGHDVIVVHRLRVVADVRRVAHDDEEIAYVESVSGEQIALDAQQIPAPRRRSEEHTSELQSRENLV